MVSKFGNRFLISTDRSSLVLRIDGIGKLLTDYYGRKLTGLLDDDHLGIDYPFPQGTSVVYSPDYWNHNLSLVKSEIATMGKGDYFSPSVILSDDRTQVFDFVYDSYRIQEPEPIDGFPTPHGASQELVIVMAERQTHARLSLHYVVYESEDVIGRYAEIINDSDLPLAVKKLSSLQLGLTNDGYRIIGLTGSWANELNRNATKLVPGKFVLSSNTGFSSNRANPCFALASSHADFTHGDVYGFNLVFSGNHEESVEMDTNQNIRVQVGYNPLLTEIVLAKSKSFVTPMAVMAYAEDGLNGLAHRFQSFVNDCVIPPYFKNRERPIAYNNWEATGFDFNDGKIKKLMKKAKDLGIELFVLDDGWFGNRDNDSQGLGDWQCNEKKIKGGLKGLSDYAHGLGMTFGIWMEPEMVNKNSKLYQSHPDWIVKDVDHQPCPGRNQYVLDLSRTEVQDFVYQSVKSVLDSAKIEFLKWDCNRPLSDYPRSGSFFLDYFKGLYRVLDRLTKAYPTVLFENCASGGNRYDLGMLSYFPQSWMSDDTDSFQRELIQYGGMLGYPQSTFSNHVAAKTSMQMLRKTSLDAKFDVAAFGVLGYELDLNDLSPIDQATLSAQISYYKAHRALFQFGILSVIESYEDGNVFSVQVHRGDEWMIGRYGAIQLANPKLSYLKALDVDPNAIYAYASRQESIPLSKFGSHINSVTPIHVNPDGMALAWLMKNKDMKSEIDQGHAYGASLLSQGPALSVEWNGTGYSDKIRLEGDFGGRIYHLIQSSKSTHLS